MEAERKGSRMKSISYTYTVIRYVHDAGSGERLNVGVAVYAPEVPFLQVRVESDCRRLSGAFAGFDSDQYNGVVDELEAAVSGEALRLTASTPDPTGRSNDVVEAMRQFWPDRSLCFQLSSPRVGTSEDLDEALEALFRRMVVQVA